ncbi:MAG: erythromycin esterase family protein, partial [Bacteroidales bacterium]|nr:erythromycin esterase family protein [Bacteroidales bacterium]
MINVSYSQKNNYYSRAYDLNFSFKDDSLLIFPWVGNAAYNNYSISAKIKEVDTLFALLYFKGSPINDRLKNEIYQVIPLPKDEFKQGELKLECKGKNIKSVSLIADIIDKDENLVRTNILKFAPDSVMNIFSSRIDLNSGKLMNITINTEGESNKESFIIFSKLNILVDNIPLDSLPLNEIVKPNFTPEILDFDAVLQKKTFNNSIIGFGESMHDNPILKDSIYKMIINEVVNNKCKLVLIEKPMESTLSYNRYIQDKDFKFDSLEIVDKQTLNFLETLRNLNQSFPLEEKVLLFGFDYNYKIDNNQGSALDIFEFLSHLNNNSVIINKLLIQLYKNNIEESLKLLLDNKEEIQELISNEEYMSIIHILEISKELTQDPIKRMILRDSVMFVNTQFIIENFNNNKDNKIAIYSHALHLNPISTYPTVPCKPFGYYMKKEYNNDYGCFLIVSNNGYIKTLDKNFNEVNSSLERCPINSVEYLFEKNKEE